MLIIYTYIGFRSNWKIPRKICVAKFVICFTQRPLNYGTPGHFLILTIKNNASFLK